MEEEQAGLSNTEFGPSMPDIQVTPEQPAAAGTAPEWDGNQWALNFKGQTVIPKDRDHLVNLAQKGYSFEQRMEALNKQQREIEQLKQQYGQYADLDEHFKSNPDFQREVMQLQQKYTTGRPSEGADPNYQALTALQRELEDLKSWKQAQIQQTEDREVQAQIDALKSKYPNHQWDVDDGNGTLYQKIIKHSLEKDIGNLESAYRDYFWDQKATMAANEALKQNASKRQEQHKAGIVESGIPAAQPPQNTFNVKGKSWDEISQEALKHL